MKLDKTVCRHRLFFIFLLLFLFVALVDLFNLDRLAYQTICESIAPVSGSVCATYYDIPIWNVYLSLAILAALYHVHGEIRTSNKHLSSQKKK